MKSGRYIHKGICRLLAPKTLELKPAAERESRELSRAFLYLPENLAVILYFDWITTEVRT
jgi:hypothetical protein